MLRGMLGDARSLVYGSYRISLDFDVCFPGMHPSISAFPSWRFYRGELKNAVTDADRQLPHGLPFRSPLVFLHVDAAWLLL